MRRLLLAALLLVALATCGWIIVRQAPAEADRPAPVSQAVAARLPVSQVVLFSSGVGYFQREGAVEGNSRVDLTFPVQDINDLLKSMVLQDLSGGQVSAVSYDSQNPIERTLKGFAVNLTGNPSYGQLLHQARGEKVEVVLQQSNTTQPGTLTGTIIGIEKQKQQVAKDAVAELDVLNLWCAEGMRAIKLAEVQRVRFLNPVLDSEMKQALEVLAMSHDTQKKAVSLNFTGEGKRNVRVGYVIENPIWKTSYRLVLGKDGKPFLQGWAMVENSTDEDWRDVRMALISGRPISFQMDLYQPLYMTRPVVEPELFASLRPPTYRGALSKELEETEAVRKPTDWGATSPYPLQKKEAAPTPRSGEKKADGKAEDRLYARELGGKLAEKIDLQRGVQSSAAGASLGDYFQYAIDHPVNLPRQKSALLPIVNKNVEGQKVSIYNEKTLNKHPLLGLKFKNTSSMNLMQGPMTVFEGSNYAGDSRILDLQPNEERLLSYAIDLGTEVQAVPDAENGKLTSVKINKGILHSTTKFKESKTYNIKNRSEQDRIILIEHPFRSEFKLTSEDKPIETASDVYRFQVNMPAGKSAKQVVSEERDVSSAILLLNSDDPTMRVFVQSTVTSPAVKAALQKAGGLKEKLAATQQEITNVKRELETIKQDQPRLRQNLEKIPGTDPLAKRILEKLNQQETDIEKYEAQLKKLNAQADQEKQAFEAYLTNLNVE